MGEKKLLGISEDELRGVIEKLAPGVRGYRYMRKVLARTEKAILCDYYGWHLWFPISQVRYRDRIRGFEVAVPYWRLVQAKDEKIERDNDYARRKA